MRPDINRGGELRPHVREYAQANGLTMPEAYAQLIEAGLEAVGEHT